MAIDPNKILANPSKYTSSAVRNAQKQVSSASKTTTKKPGPLKRLKNWNEEGGGDKLGSLSNIAAELGGKGLDGVSPQGTPVGEGAASSIQYTNLDQEVDTQQAKIRKQIEALKA